MWLLQGIECDLNFIIVTIFIAVLGSWLALDNVITSSSLQEKRDIIRSGFLCIGLGITFWSMNILGIIGNQCLLPIKFNVSLLGLSLVFYLCYYALVFYMANKEYYKKKIGYYASIFFVSVLFLTAQFLSIYAVEGKGEIQFDWGLVLLGMVYILVASLLLLFFLTHPKDVGRTNLSSYAKKLAKVIIVGGLIVGVQYSLLGAVTFGSTPPLIEYIHSEQQTIAFVIGGAGLFIFISFMMVAYVDREKMITQKELLAGKYKSLFQNSPLLVIEVDNEGTIIDMNEISLSKLNCSKESLLSTSIYSLFLNEDRKLLKETLLRARSEQENFIDLPIAFPSNEFIDLRITFLPIKQDNQIIGFYLLGRDVTLLKESSRKLHQAEGDLRDILNNQMSIIIKFKKVDHQFVYTLIGGQLLFKLGFEAKDYLGKTLKDLPINLDRYFFHLKYYELAWRGEEVIYEYPFGDRTLLNSLMPVSKEGKIVEVISTIVDITEQKKAEKRILLAKEQADKANKAKSEFLSKMSHELRTPLNGVLGFTQILEMEKDLTPIQRSHVQEIFTAGKHLLHLIDSVLDLARIESGKLNLIMKKVDISHVLQESVKLVSSSALQKNIQIHTQAPLEAVFVLADMTKLKQIFINLLDNAIKYNYVNGSIHIEVFQQKGLANIIIRDTGIGIPEEELQKVFTPFYRSKSLNGCVEGTGIGLSLVKQFVESFKGKVQLKNGAGGGAMVCMDLPIYHEGDNINTQYSHEEAFPQLKIPYSTVLYIEDNKMNQSFVHQLFKSYKSVNLLSALTGEEGLKLLKKQPVDLILLDMNLPDIHGLDIIDLVRLDEKMEVPIITVSANALKGEIEKAKQAGADEYVTKPIDVPILITILNNYLGRGNL